MAIENSYSKPLSFADLLQFKALEPLSAAKLEQLEKIEKLDVKKYSEAEVRSFIIDPIIKILGYDKETIFSVDLEKPLKFLNRNKYPDYKATLWQENFWLLEAKKPKPRKISFGYQELAQAVEYAIHPEINAAIVALCDGIKFEIFDRETNLIEPILRVEIKNLAKEFDNIRLLLGPWQSWYFQKRRAARLIDKVFDKEFNFGRISEYVSFIERRLTSKRSTIIENFRNNVRSDHHDKMDYLSSASTEELVNIQFFIEQSHPLADRMIDTLVQRCESKSFQVMSMIFPDLPRDASPTYHGHALMFLAALGERRETVEWLPAWLAPEKNQRNCSLELITRGFLLSCLNLFENDLTRRIILLAESAMRRVLRLMFMSSEQQWQFGHMLHVLTRYHANDLSWGQIVSTPEGQLSGRLAGLVLTLTKEFVTSCSAGQEFKTESAKSQLRELWKLEAALLAALPDYKKLRTERKIGNMIPDSAEVTFDRLGHTSLCLLHRFPQWTSYAAQTHHSTIESLAFMGSWKAKEILGYAPMDEFGCASRTELANRFFFGDIKTLDFLLARYTASPTSMSPTDGSQS